MTTQWNSCIINVYYDELWLAVAEEEDEEEDHLEVTESQPLSGEEKWASRIDIYLYICNKHKYVIYVIVWVFVFIELSHNI